MVIIHSKEINNQIAASLEKFKLIKKSLEKVNVKTEILFSTSSSTSVGNDNYYNVDEQDFITINTKNSRNFFFKKFLFKINEYRYFKQRVENYRSVTFIISRINPLDFFYYYLLTKLLRISLVVSIMEWHIELTRHSSILYKIDAWFFDKISFKFVRKVITISSFIKDKVLKVNPKLEILIIPSLVDMRYFNSALPESRFSEYLLYCGSLAYFDVIKFILDSYDLYRRKSKHPLKLLLIVNGNQNLFIDLRLYVKDNPDIIIESKLTYSSLINRYISARALIIPLRETLQDKARFPQKVAEYLASGRPVITNNWGEVSKYLKNNINALVADSYDKIQYSDLFCFVENNYDDLNRIGANGRDLSNDMFNYEKYSAVLKDFLEVN